MGRGGARRRAENPRLTISRKARPPKSPGIGDRALLRIEETGDTDEAIRHTGRVIKIIDRAKQRMLGIFRSLPGGGGRLVPVDKKALGRELAIPPGATGNAQDGELVAADVAKARPLRPAGGPHEGAPGLAQERARRQPDRHPRALAFRMYFHAKRWPKPRPQNRPIWPAARIGVSIPLDHHRPDRRQGSRRCGVRRARHRSRQWRRPYRQCRDRRRRALRAAGLARSIARPGTRQFGLFPRPRRADAAGANFQRSVLAQAECRSRRARGAHGDRR